MHCMWGLHMQSMPCLAWLGLTSAQLFEMQGNSNDVAHQLLQELLGGAGSQPLVSSPHSKPLLSTSHPPSQTFQTADAQLSHGASVHSPANASSITAAPTASGSPPSTNAADGSPASTDAVQQVENSKSSQPAEQHPMLSDIRATHQRDVESSSLPSAPSSMHGRLKPPASRRAPAASPPIKSGADAEARTPAAKPGALAAQQASTVPAISASAQALAPTPAPAEASEDPVANTPQQHKLEESAPSQSLLARQQAARLSDSSPALPAGISSQQQQQHGYSPVQILKQQNFASTALNGNDRAQLPSLQRPSRIIKERQSPAADAEAVLGSPEQASSLESPESACVEQPLPIEADLHPVDADISQGTSTSLQQPQDDHATAHSAGNERPSGDRNELQGSSPTSPRFPGRINMTPSLEAAGEHSYIDSLASSIS